MTTQITSNLRTENGVKCRYFLVLAPTYLEIKNWKRRLNASGWENQHYKDARSNQGAYCSIWRVENPNPLTCFLFKRDYRAIRDLPPGKSFKPIDNRAHFAALLSKIEETKQ